MKHFFHFHLPQPGWRKALLAGLGAGLGIALLTLATDYANFALIMAPFGATCVLLFAAPTAPLSQPMNVVAGHGVSAAIGLALGFLVPLGMITAAAAVGLAVAAMVGLRIVHPPAGATAFVAVKAAGWGFLFFPVLSGSLVLVALAAGYHWLAGNTYPVRVLR